MFGDCDAGIIVQIETQVGNKYHEDLEFTEFGQLAAMSLCLTKPWHTTNLPTRGSSASTRARRCSLRCVL
eukprot:6197261-Pleurochrysis_carterae.AAC.1